MRVLLLPVLMLSVAGACSPEPSYDPTPTPSPAPEAAPAASAAAAAFDPSGMYDFVASLGSETRSGTLEIERNANGFGGEAWLEGEGDPARIVSGSMVGNHVILNGLVGLMDVTFELDFTGATFAGTITAGDDAISVTGTKRAE